MSKKKKFECSCGKTFTKKRGLEFHRDLHKCEPLETEAVVDVPEDPPELVQEPIEMEEATQTLAVVSNWQRPQTSYQFRLPQVDWPAVRATTLEFLASSGALLSELLVEGWNAVRGISQITARVMLFCAVTVTVIVHTLAEARNQRPLREYKAERKQMAVRALVEDFLENGELHQFSKAKGLLDPSLRTQVSEIELEQMFSSLPLQQDPESWELDFADGGRTATVTLRRAGADETYLLVHHQLGWGLTSVSVNSSH